MVEVIVGLVVVIIFDEDVFCVVTVVVVVDTGVVVDGDVVEVDDVVVQPAPDLEPRGVARRQVHVGPVLALAVQLGVAVGHWRYRSRSGFRKHTGVVVRGVIPCYAIDYRH